VFAVPGVLAIGAALRVATPRLSRFGTPLAVAGIAVIVVLQALLVAGVLTFEQEIGPATVGFVAMGSWMVVAAVAGRRTGDRHRDQDRTGVPVRSAGAAVERRTTSSNGRPRSSSAADVPSASVARAGASRRRRAAA